MSFLTALSFVYLKLLNLRNGNRKEFGISCVGDMWDYFAEIVTVFADWIFRFSVRSKIVHVGFFVTFWWFVFFNGTSYLLIMSFDSFKT